MMAGTRDCLQHRLFTRDAPNDLHISPGFIVIEAIQRMARGNAGFATGTEIEIDFERVLFAGSRRVQRKKFPIAISRRMNSSFMTARESTDGSHRTLIKQKLINDAQRFVFG
jgi:hypothetical protein